MKKQTMEFRQIHSALQLRNIKFSDIAEALKVTSSMPATIAKRKGSSLRIATAICHCLEKQIHEVFGDVDSYINQQTRRGPRDRTERKKQIVEAIRAGEPIPLHESMSQ